MVAYGNEERTASSDPAIGLIPKPEDWVDYGPILEAGGEGDWDFAWGGSTPGAVVKNDGIYYFYYVAGDGYRSFDGDVRNRSIGVATSQDGIHFTKYPGNPIMTHSPLDGEEEGANSAGVTLDANGNFVMFYGAATGEKDIINADGRLAVSTDGFHFTDMGMVMNHLNPFLYGFGDEIFPVAAFHYNGRWNIYYEPNGGMNSRTLGMAWGNRPDRLLRSTGVLDEGSGGKPVGTWGNITWLAPDSIALFIQRLIWPDTFIEVRTASPDAPHRLSEQVTRYDIPNLKRGTIFLDTEYKTWFMYYNDFDRFWDLKLAPAGEPDTTPPAAPAELSANPLSHTAVELSWQAATDPETGVVIYRVYRDGDLLGSTKDWTFTDSGLAELSQHSYQVSAVNFHGFEGPKASITATTPADTSPPKIVSATTDGNPAQLLIKFSEPVDKETAENVANYATSPGIKATKASLQADETTVRLSTSGHAEGSVYTLYISGVLDQAALPNAIATESQVVYTYSSNKGLVGYWNLDQGAGETALDVSGFANHGLIVGATWQGEMQDGALQFDGLNDYVFIEDRPPLDNLTNHSFTFSALVKPAELPREKAYAIVLRVSEHPSASFGLSFVRGKYRAHIINDSENLFSLDSPPFEPGEWRHVAMVVDAETRELHLYVDGEAVEGSPVVYSGELNDLKVDSGENRIAGEYYIGSTKPDLGAGSFFTQHFKGSIDEVYIFNQALDPERIYCLANSCH